LLAKFENKKMKTHIKHLILVIFTAFIFSCNNNESKEDSIKYKCKSENRDSFIIDRADTLSCVNFTYSASTDKLVLEHINTAFNCCPGTIGWTVRVSQDSILIEERASSNDCLCECLYDLTIEIMEVEVKSYVVKFDEPNKKEWEEEIIFKIELAQKTEGSFCAKRPEYPWGFIN
jgi:hypothetical protein